MAVPVFIINYGNFYLMGPKFGYYYVEQQTMATAITVSKHNKPFKQEK
jgi:hypothetical protein